VYGSIGGWFLGMKRLTLEDIAKIAGVSSPTVSRVINNKTGARSKVRERILQVIAETGFQPHAAASCLASQRSKVIGLLVPAPVSQVFGQLYFMRLAEYMTQACQDHDYLLSLFLTGSYTDEKTLLSKVTRQGFVDGLVVRVVEEKETDVLLSGLSRKGIPFVVSGRPAEPNRISYVAADNYAAAHKALSHLLSLGRRRIGLIIASAEIPGGHDRLAGYRKVLAEHGIPVDERLIAVNNNGYNATRALLDIDAKPDAIFFATSIALGVLRALREAGSEVPDDIALIGFDDLPLARQTDPPLTTMRQPMAVMGRQLIDILIDLINDGAMPPRQVVFKEELVVRQSCGGFRELGKEV
jgi:LacI family transcriptional regulator